MTSIVWAGDGYYTDSTLLVLLVLADFSDDDGNSYPKRSTIARKIGKSERQVQRILKILENDGVVEIKRGPKNRLENIKIKGDKLSLLKNQGRHSQQNKGDMGVSPFPINHLNEPSGSLYSSNQSSKTRILNYNSNTKSTNVKENSNTQDSKKFEYDFKAFWAAYPRKQKKQEAQKALKKAMKDTPLLTILKALDEHKKLRQWQNLQFIPLAASWLNGRRWEDELSDEEMAGAQPPANGAGQNPNAARGGSVSGNRIAMENMLLEDHARIRGELARHDIYMTDILSGEATMPPGFEGVVMHKLKTLKGGVQSIWVDKKKWVEQIGSDCAIDAKVIENKDDGND